MASQSIFENTSNISELNATSLEEKIGKLESTLLENTPPSATLAKVHESITHSLISLQKIPSESKEKNILKAKFEELDRIVMGSMQENQAQTNFDEFKQQFTIDFPRENLFSPSGPLYTARESLVNTSDREVHHQIVEDTLKEIANQIDAIQQKRLELNELKNSFSSTRGQEINVMEGWLRNREANLVKQRTILLEEQKLPERLESLKNEMNLAITSPVSNTPPQMFEDIESQINALSINSDIYKKCCAIATDKSPVRNREIQKQAIELVTTLETKATELSSHLKNLAKENPDAFYAWCSSRISEDDLSTGDAAAQNHLGWCYQNGLGVPIDINKARWLFNEACSKDFTDAFFNLGQSLAEEGLEEYESFKIHQFYEFAILLGGHTEAQHSLEKLGRPVPERNFILLDLQTENPRKMLAKAGFNPHEIEVIDTLVQQLLSNQATYVHISRDKTGDDPKPFALTKKGDRIFIHKKQLGIGSSKVAKLILEYQGEMSARLVPRKTNAENILDEKQHAASVEQMEHEKRFLTLTKGLEGIIQARSVEDIKLDKTTGSPKVAFLLEPFSSDLSKLVSQPNVPLKFKLELFRQVCIGIKHLHEQGILHRDIKPANMLINFIVDNLENSKAVVSDFDLAIQKQDADFVNQIHNSSTGTEGYKAPEMEKRSELEKCLKDVEEMDDPYFHLGIKMDLFSLGISLSEVAYGKNKPGKQEIKIQTPQGTTNVSFNSTTAPHGIFELNQLITSLTNPNPWQRPPIDDVINQIADILDLIDDTTKTKWA